MKERMPWWRLTVLMGVALAAAGCVASAGAGAGGGERGPLNLSLAKAAVSAYYADGTHELEVGEVASALIAWLERPEVKAERDSRRAAVVFDLDETLLCNRAHIEGRDFGYVPEVWDAYVEAGEAEGIGPMIAAAARAAEVGYALFFITGRPESARAATERNLQALGVARPVELWFTGDGPGGTVEAKTRVRRDIEARGYRIVANVGDQWSDLEGGVAERIFLVPNPMYLIP